MKEVNAFNNSSSSSNKRYRFGVNFNDIDIPKKVKSYKSVWYHDPVSQGKTNTCWSFATMSLLESEAERLSGKEVKLSEMYVVYWEYVERAKYFVRNRGNMFFWEGSQANAVTRSIKNHGIVPERVFNGKLDGQFFLDHYAMFEELKSYLSSVIQRNEWDEIRVVSTVKSILSHYMEEKPSSFLLDGRTVTPLEYVKILGLNMYDYVNVVSFMEDPYYKKTQYRVRDNWWHSDDYLNVPLNSFMKAIKSGIKAGYSIVISGDVSEPGFDKTAQAAIIPSFDVASENIDEAARQMRFNNNSTSDDHLMHLVGYKERKNGTWFLVKDSGSGPRNCGASSDKFGYFFMHEDYVKLKMLTVTIHKDVMKKDLAKFN